MRRFFLLSALMAAAACGGPSSSQPPAGGPPVAQPKGGDDPGRALTPVECAQAVDHVLAFPAASPDEQKQIDSMKAARDAMIAQCGKEGQKKDYDCLMASKSMQELGNCEEPAGADKSPAPVPAPK